MSRFVCTAFAAAMVGLVSPPVAAQCGLEMTPRTPQGRSGHVVFFDRVLGGLVVHGGRVWNQRLTDTWSWSGTRWSHLSDAGPGAYRTTYDTGRRRAVMLVNAQTWEWDGSGWADRAVAGPPSRSVPAIGYDPLRGETVVFGGTYNGSQEYADTWVWDGVAWSLAAETGPRSRASGGMAFDEARGVLVLYGGYYHVGSYYTVGLSDTWTWDGSAWTEHAVSGPGPVGTPGMAYDPDRGRVVLCAGEGETWEWDGSEWTQAAASAPGERSGYKLVWEENLRRVVLVDGADSADLWAWDGGAWEAIEDGGPGPRTTSAMARDHSTGEIVLFGGYEQVHQLGDTWLWDGVNWRAVQGGGPSARGGHAMAPMLDGRGVLLTGGWDDYGSIGDTWVFRDGAWEELPSALIPPRSGHGIAVDTDRSRIVIFGGIRGNDDLRGDTWEFDGESWRLVADTGPSPRAPGGGMTYDPVRRRVVLHSATPYGDPETWEWDGQAWELRFEGGPYPSRPLVFDERRGAVLQFDGEAFWLWDGQAWTADGPAPFDYRTGSAMVYDGARAEVVLFGGRRSAGGLQYHYADTWARGPAGRARIVGQPESIAAEPGAEIEMSVASESGLSQSYRWRREGEPLADGPTQHGSIVAGAATPTLQIAGIAPEDAGAYDCLVSTDCGDSVSAPAVLRVRCAADFNGDDAVDTQDIVAFLNAWAAQDAGADITGDGVIDSRDVIAFLNFWVAGC